MKKSESEQTLELLLKIFDEYKKIKERLDIREKKDSVIIEVKTPYLTRMTSNRLSTSLQRAEE